MQDLVAGQIDLLFSTPDQLPLVHAGRHKAYAVTSDTRLALAPDIPTFKRDGTARAFLLQLVRAFRAQRHAKGDDRQAQCGGYGGVGRSGGANRGSPILGKTVFPRERQTPEALGAMVKADAEKWWPIIKEFGIKAE